VQRYAHLARHAKKAKRALKKLRTLAVAKCGISVASLSGSNVAVGIANFLGNPHDSKTLAPTLDQVVQWTGQRYARVLADKSYRGHGQVGSSAVLMPGKKAHASAYALRRQRPCVSDARR